MGVGASMKVLLLGANGQMGSDIRRLWDDADIQLVCATRADADVTDNTAIAALIERERPNVVINTTAFHNLPLAEEDPETCFRVNVVGGWNVAKAAVTAGASIVQISTDYVFDGSRRGPYVEDSARRALNVYGAAKIAAEDLVRQANPDHLVVRVSGLYGLAGSAGKGGNFVETMLRLAREGKPLRVVADQVTAPTNTAEIAEGLLPLIKQEMRGTVHLAADGECSWHDFAAAIFELSRLSPGLEPVTTEEFGGPVRRPLYSVLGSSRVSRLGHWRDGLERYLRERAEV
jgi:dTDP-4-dehydrorhamnose reductase